MSLQDEFTERKELAANENTKKVKGSHKKSDKKRKNKKDVQGDIEEKIEEPQWKSGDNPRSENNHLSKLLNTRLYIDIDGSVNAQGRDRQTFFFVEFTGTLCSGQIM